LNCLMLLPHADPEHTPGGLCEIAVVDGVQWTSGEDGHVRGKAPDGSPVVYIGSPISCFAVAGHKAVVGKDGSAVQAEIFDVSSWRSTNLGDAKVILRGAAPITHVVFHPLESDDIVGMCTEDGRIVEHCISTGAKQEFKLSQAEVIASIAYDNAGKWLLAILYNGKVVVFSRGSQQVVWTQKLLPALPLEQSTKLKKWRASFHPDGTCVAVPGAFPHCHIVSIADRSWTQRECRSTGGGHDAIINIAVFSQKGDLLATCGVDDKICIWQWPSNALLRMVSTQSFVQSAVWESSALCVICRDASVARLECSAFAKGVVVAVPDSETPGQSGQHENREDAQPEVRTQPLVAVPECSDAEEVPGLAEPFQPGAWSTEMLYFCEYGHAYAEKGRAVIHQRTEQRSANVGMDQVMILAVGPDGYAYGSSPDESGDSRITVVGSQRVCVQVRSLKCLAMGEGFFAAACEHNLHIFSRGGVHLACITLADRPISLAAHRGFLLMAQEDEGRLQMSGKFCRQVVTTVYDVDNRQVVHCGRLPLPSAARVKWLGFSAEAMPLVFISTGVVFALVHHWGDRRWAHVVDLKECDNTVELLPVGGGEDQVTCLVKPINKCLQLSRHPHLRSIQFRPIVVANSQQLQSWQVSMSRDAFLAHHAKSLLGHTANDLRQWATKAWPRFCKSHDLSLARYIERCLQTRSFAMAVDCARLVLQAGKTARVLRLLGEKFSCEELVKVAAELAVSVDDVASREQAPVSAKRVASAAFPGGGARKRLHG